MKAALQITLPSNFIIFYQNLYKMLQKVGFFIGCLFVFKAANGQTKDSAALTHLQNDNLAIYAQAIAYSDLSTAAGALVNYLHYMGQTNYKDTLALIYYNSKNMAGAYKIANELIESNPKDLTALHILADITARIGETKNSLDWYEKLTVLQPQPYYYYQLAAQQFLLERNLECKLSLEKAMKDTVAGKQQQIRMEVDNNRAENVPVLAAAMNMMGAIAFREKNLLLAKKWYSDAVSVFPSFVIAQQNLKDLNSNEKPAAQLPKTQKSGKPKPQ